MERELYFKQEKKTAIIYFLFTSIVPSHHWLLLQISSYVIDCVYNTKPCFAAAHCKMPVRWQHCRWKQGHPFRKGHSSKAHSSTSHPWPPLKWSSLIQRSLLAWLCLEVYRNLVKIGNMLKSWFLMLQNKLHFSHLLIFFFEVYLAWGEGSSQHVGRETLQLTCTPFRWAGPKILNLFEQTANNLKVPDLREMTEDKNQLDSLFSRGS